MMDNCPIDKLSTNKINIPTRFSGDFNINVDDGEKVAQNTSILINKVKVIGLNVNDNKTKVMQLLPDIKSTI